MTISWWAQTAHLRPTEVLQLHLNHWTDIKRCELADIIFWILYFFSPQEPQGLKSCSNFPIFPSSLSYCSLESLLGQRHTSASSTQPSSPSSSPSQLCCHLKLAAPKLISVHPLLSSYFWVIFFRTLPSHIYSSTGIKGEPQKTNFLLFFLLVFFPKREA